MRYDLCMELLIGVGVFAIALFGVSRLILGSERRRREEAAALGRPGQPVSLAELRMWEKHYGLQAQRGLTPDQRKAEIAQLRQRDGI